MFELHTESENLTTLGRPAIFILHRKPCDCRLEPHFAVSASLGNV